ncbi:MAG: tRNA-dihydrouridine synthase B [Parcubacteria bacterium C7867-008]|nr:MAG: tRNA-dihydrouridine synthase B [Parcubacteria bacterium C7867-008]
MDSFWKHLPKPFFALAPMADVTDPAYRRLIADYGVPHVTWTEFVSADGLYHTREKKGMKDEENPLVRDLQYSEAERPIVAQIFGSNPETIAYASELAATLGFDGVDINMGCPDRSIEKQGAGAAMIKNPELVKPIVEAARRGAARGKEGGIPVSLKTRIGYHQETMDTWLPVVLASKPDALTVHLRTRKEMSKVDAHWELMARAVALRNEHSPDTIILGNGDVKDLDDARLKAALSGADGIMLGRAIFGSPWLFTDRKPNDISPTERIEALRTFAQYFSELRPTKSFHLLKKHIKSFIAGWDGAAQLRGILMEASTQEELDSILAALKP